MVVCNTYPENGCYYFPPKKEKKNQEKQTKILAQIHHKESISATWCSHVREDFLQEKHPRGCTGNKVLDEKNIQNKVVGNTAL